MTLEQITKQWQAVHRGACLAIELAKKQGSHAQVAQFRRIAEDAVLKTDLLANAILSQSLTSPDMGNEVVSALYEAGLNASTEASKVLAPAKQPANVDSRIEKMREKTRSQYAVGDVVTAHWGSVKSSVFGVKPIALMDGISFREPKKVRIVYINDRANAVKVEVL